MEESKAEVIAAEIKIELTAKSLDEVESLIKKVNEMCKSDYHLTVAIDATFLKD